MAVPDLSKLFHASSKDHSKGHPPIAENSAEWPPEWRTIYYKEYPRLPRIALTDTLPEANLFEVIRNRKSDRAFHSTPLSLDEISTLLKYSCGIVSQGDLNRRAHPSAGARFPIEIYPLILTPAGEVEPGVYHYNLREHALETLWQKNFSKEDLSALFTYSWVQGASLVAIMTATFARTQQKYGERGYRYIVLEAGHIAQNLTLVANALGLKCCALAGTHDQNIESLLDIDGTTESLIYAVILGK